MFGFSSCGDLYHQRLQSCPSECNKVGGRILLQATSTVPLAKLFANLSRRLYTDVWSMGGLQHGKARVDCSESGIQIQVLDAGAIVGIGGLVAAAFFLDSGFAEFFREAIVKVSCRLSECNNK